MSTKISACMIAQLPVDERVMHCVPDGETKCILCGLSKFRMRFHYTSDTELFHLLRGERRIGMLDPTDNTIYPYHWCVLYEEEAGDGPLH